jgi:hypothetical protein
MSDVTYAAPAPDYVWSRHTLAGRVYWGRQDRDLAGTSITVGRHFVGVAVCGRYAGICWR